MNNDRIISQEGYERIERELEDLRTRGRKEIAQAISQAREFGDISENAEYEAAKNDQALLEARIYELEEDLRRLRVVDESERQRGVAGLGSRVELSLGGKEQRVTLVSSFESDLQRGLVSISSPVGKAIAGMSSGDEGYVLLPNGRRRSIRIISVRG